MFEGGESMRTIKIELLPTVEQKVLLKLISAEYIKTINMLVSDMVKASGVLKLTSKDVCDLMPSAVKNQVIRGAKSVFRKSKKLKTVPVLKKPQCIWNNQNYQIKENTIEYPVLTNGKSKRITLKAIASEYQRQLLNHAIKSGALRITQKSSKWIAQIAIQEELPDPIDSDIIMGVDLGLKVPAVAKSSSSVMAERIIFSKEDFVLLEKHLAKPRSSVSLGNSPTKSSAG